METMKQFNLEEYLRLKGEGKEPKIVTRDGCSVRIICTDRKNLDGCLIVALVEVGSKEREVVRNYSPDGTWPPDDDARYDLFFVPYKHEGWVNLYHFYDTVITDNTVYNSESKAKSNVKSGDYIATIKIEWEE